MIRVDADPAAGSTAGEQDPEEAAAAAGQGHQQVSGSGERPSPTHPEALGGPAHGQGPAPGAEGAQP